MSTIWKFELEITVQNITIPTGAEILSVANQHGTICLWAFVEPNNPKIERVIEVVGTGWMLEPMKKRKFIGTVLDGSFVWHVFERT